MEKTQKQLTRLLGLIAVLLVTQVTLSGTILLNIKKSSPAVAIEAAGHGEFTSQVSKAEPIETVSEASVADAYVRGDTNAVLAIIEFSDFECPYCNQAYPVMMEILKNYDGKVKLAYRHFPLGIHAHAYGAALAAEAAGDQGKFWEMHDLIFEKAKTGGAKALARDNLISYAEVLNLDIKKFTDDLDSERFGSKVRTDFDDGEKYGVSGTPTFFINGRKVAGAFPYKEMSRIVEEELAKMAQK